MPDNIAIDILADVAQGNDLVGTSIKKDSVSQPVKLALAAWLDSVNLQDGDVSDDVAKASYSKNSAEYYVFSFDASVATKAPEVFTGMVIIQGDTVVGVSSSESH